MNDLVRTVARLVIDYFRWTQLVPMLACWGFLAAILLAFVVNSFESQGITAFEIVIAVVLAIASLLPEAILPRGADGSIELSGDDVTDLAAWAWLLFSIVAMAINWLVGERLRPRFLATLAGRLKAAAIGAILFSVALVLIRILAPDHFNGSLSSWLPTLIGLPLIAWIVSAYSLSVSAILTLLDQHVVSKITGAWPP